MIKHNVTEYWSIMDEHKEYWSILTEHEEYWSILAEHKEYWKNTGVCKISCILEQLNQLSTKNTAVY